MQVVLADGSVIRVGGRVVKNVAGYDLCKLFTGSYGSLGIITELNFKLRPRPSCETTVLATGTADQLLASGRAILDARLFPVAVELVSSAFANRLGIETNSFSAALLVRFAGNEKGVAYQVEQSLIHLKNAAVKRTDVLTEDTALWQSVAAMPLQLKPSFTTRVLPAKLAESIPGHSFTEWQAGIADGRIRIMNHAAPQAVGPANPLDQRVKQQLDPFNLLRGHEDEHDS
jgi:hypothetical protein